MAAVRISAGTSLSSSAARAGVSYQGVSQAAGFVMSDIAKVQAICP